MNNLRGFFILLREISKSKVALNLKLKHPFRTVKDKHGFVGGGCCNLLVCFMTWEKFGKTGEIKHFGVAEFVFFTQKKKKTSVLRGTHRHMGKIIL